MRTAHRVRLASILAVGAFALHQLRYLIAVGGRSSTAPPEGHRYMSDLLPPIAVLVLAALLATLIRGTEAAATPDGRRWPAVSAVFAGALLRHLRRSGAARGTDGLGPPRRAGGGVRRRRLDRRAAGALRSAPWRLCSLARSRESSGRSR